MLVTTCPACETAFRVSDEILDKAHGQVRCGRCAHIFDARATLCEQEDGDTRSIFDEVALRAEPATAGAAAAAAASDGEAEPEPESEPEPEPEPEPESESEPESRPESGPESESGLALAGPEVTAEFTGEAAAEVAAEVDADPAADTSWLPALRDSGERRRWPYLTAGLVLALILLAQLVHAFRGDLLAAPRIGPTVAWVYAQLGIEARANVDLAQFELFDLAAIAEPITPEQGLLIIETRLRNNGPRPQPIPYVLVSLLDRWQDRIAGRYFAPDEYTVGTMHSDELMASDTTIDAQFVIVDPGPGATGFELQLCTPVAQGFACDGDETFR